MFVLLSLFKATVRRQKKKKKKKKTKKELQQKWQTVLLQFKAKILFWLLPTQRIHGKPAKLLALFHLCLFDRVLLFRPFSLLLLFLFSFLYFFVVYVCCCLLLTLIRAKQSSIMVVKESGEDKILELDSHKLVFSLRRCRKLSLATSPVKHTVSLLHRLC